VTEDPVEDVVRAGAVCFRQFVLEHPALFRIAFQHEAVTDDLVSEFRAASQDALGRLTDRLERVAAAGGLGTTSPAAAACYFHATCEGMAAMEMRGSFRADPETAWSEALRAIVRGLA
jgi:hypothetical protein